MNRLANETSPYLRQHADNPVDWYPWGEEAFDRARELDVPVFLSIGYSACHWCHVMAHESFEDEATATVMNDRFVAIKVDREERPDIDAVYMEAAQALTGSGGWPLSVFLTSDGRPFFAGTYFPKRAMGRTPSFVALLDAVSAAWSTGRRALLEQADELTGAIARRLDAPEGSGDNVDPDAVVAAGVERFAAVFDPDFGGTGTAPKFPQPPTLELVLLAASRGDAGARSMVMTTLEHLAAGGIYDHLGGGFCRYSVDRTWTVPHFEKMLYDQAGLLRLYAHAYALEGDERWRQVASETAAYVLRDLALPGGGFASAEDADSEGEEGKFYVWGPDEVDALLGPDRGPNARAWWGIDGTPNFEGKFIPLRRSVGAIARTPEIESARRDLLEARSERVRPGLDDKVLTEWNGMMISALCEAAGALDEPRLAEAAAAAGRFLLGHLRREDGRWLRSYKDGRANHLGLLADHGWVVESFVRLAEATGDGAWIDEATTTAAAMVELFGAPDGGFFSTGSDAERLVVRPRDLYDGVIPSATAIAADALWRLGAITGDSRWTERSAETVGSLADVAATAPLAFPHLVAVAKRLADGPIEVVVTGRRTDLVAVARARYLPGGVVAWGDERGPLFTDRSGAQAYVCVGGACRQPVGDPSALEDAITDALAGHVA